MPPRLDPCLLCLSSCSRKGPGWKISSLLKLALVDNYLQLQNDIHDENGKCWICPECGTLLKSAEHIYTEITQLKTKLRSEIVLIRGKIQESERKVGILKEKKDIFRIRKSFLNLSDEKRIENEEQPIIFNDADEEVKIKEEVDPLAFDFDLDGPSSPTAFLIHPDDSSGNQSEEEEILPDIRPKRKSKVVKKYDIEDDDEDEEYYEEEIEPKKSKRNFTRKSPGRRKISQHPHPCKLCDRSFLKNFLLISHIFKAHENETKDKRFSCEKCDKKFGFEMLLERHLELHKEENEKPFICNFCDTRFKDQSKLDAHSTTHDKIIKCYYCPKEYTTYVKRSLHMQNFHPNEKPYQCHHCEEKFFNHLTRKTHIDTVHKKYIEVDINDINPDAVPDNQKESGNQKIKILDPAVYTKRGRTRKRMPKIIEHTCTVCDAKFQKNFLLISHIFRRHEKEDKPFSCEICPKKFTLEIMLQRHIEGHKQEKEKPLVCDSCDTRFKDKAKFDIHIASHNKIYKCEHCSKLFRTYEGRNRHLRMHSDFPKPFQCEHCEEAFIDNQSRKVHIEKIHDNTVHPCTVSGCDKTFNTRGGLSTHVKQQHDGKFNVDCGDCGEVFKYRRNLQSHKVRVHGADPLVCDECGATLLSITGLRKHKLLHTGVKNYKCDICHAAFSAPYTLKTHLATHSDERPYVCSFCGHGFKIRRTLTEHERTVHNKNYKPELKVPCPHCPQKFQYKSRLETHLKQAHSAEKSRLESPSKRSSSSKLKSHKKRRRKDESSSSDSEYSDEEYNNEMSESSANQYSLQTAHNNSAINYQNMSHHLYYQRL